jgi:hypothetical protein
MSSQHFIVCCLSFVFAFLLFIIQEKKKEEKERGIQEKGSAILSHNNQE